MLAFGHAFPVAPTVPGFLVATVVNLGLAAGMVREAAALTTQIGGEVIPSDKPGCLALALKEPVGVILGIAPWNAPIILGVRADLISAQMGGLANGRFLDHLRIVFGGRDAQQLNPQSPKSPVVLQVNYLLHAAPSAGAHAEVQEDGLAGEAGQGHVPSRRRRKRELGCLAPTATGPRAGGAGWLCEQAAPTNARAAAVVTASRAFFLMAALLSVAR